MSIARARLTDADIRRLVKSDDEDERAAAAHKLCRRIDRAELGEEERAAAQKILRVLAEDAAEMVRRALAVTLKCSDLLPRDVALRLARDVDAVALPVIAFSPVFTDEDLLDLVRSGAEARQVAVAGRPRVSRDVATGIADMACAAAVRTLCANDNADLSEPAMGRALDRFADRSEIVSAMAYRQVLPVSITERLVELASEAVREHLVTRHALAPETAIRLATAARERATVDLIDQAAAAQDLAKFCASLSARKALSASLLLRALARGCMPFVEHGLAELSGVAHHRAWLMVHDAGPLGLRAIYDRAGLPPRLFAAFRAGVDTWRDLHAEAGASLDREQFQERMLERYLTSAVGGSREDVAYLLERLDRPADILATRVSAA
ncbi:DUF2336 domain-containing protein [Brevundimonas sp. 2R-24]|uniref:DUF2336 domain-containing protein n=1 Tax=Peiella sedimenti TaxID=3061083 RepID=A0ABT8SKX5_9CAUL|nr:DUF2336 domain-containing protein [Caulobacteraceae bacterium XZ-24]